MAERVVAMLYHVKYPRSKQLYGWLALTEDAPGVPLLGDTPEDLRNAATAHLNALFGGDSFHIELVSFCHRYKE